MFNLIGRSFQFSMLIIGTIIGAGFASGREVVAMFTAYNNAIPIMVVIAVGLSSYFLASIGSKNDKSIYCPLHSRVGSKAINMFVGLNSLIVMSSMLSALTSIGGSIALPRYAITIPLGIISIIIVSRGIGFITKINAIIVPLIIVILVSITFNNIESNASLADFSILSVAEVIIYVSMNMLLASSALTAHSSYSKKEIIISSVISAIVVGILMGLISSVLASNPVLKLYPMPILELAKNNSPLSFSIILVCIVTSIFTTLLTSVFAFSSYLRPLIKNKLCRTAITVVIGFCISLLGFSVIVDTLYPIIGLLGVGYIGLCVIDYTNSTCAEKLTSRSMPPQNTFRPREHRG